MRHIYPEDLILYALLITMALVLIVVLIIALVNIGIAISISGECRQYGYDKAATSWPLAESACVKTVTVPLSELRGGQ